MRQSEIPAWVGFLLLSAMTVGLFLLTFVGVVLRAPVVSVAKAMVVIGLAVGLYLEARRVARSAQRRLTGNRGTGSTADFAAVFIGSAVTFLISVEFGLGAVVASGLVGLLGAALIKSHATALFCGSFVGMSSSAVFAYFPWILLAGAIAALLFVLSSNVLNGFGGKLGTMAFFGAVTAALVGGLELQSMEVPTGGDAAWIVGYSVLAALVTYSLSIYLGNGPVVASALVGIAAGLLLPAIHGTDVGPTLAVVAFCASFAGMSSSQRLPNALAAGTAGLFCGLVFLYASPYFHGAGGKLGTIAFGSTIAVWGLIELARPALRTTAGVIHMIRAPWSAGS